MADVIQLRRTKGWRKPEGAVVVARPSKWGNPFAVGDCIHVTIGPWSDRPRNYHADLDRAAAVDLFRIWVESSLNPEAAWIRDHVHELAGKTLACWCPQPGPCHAHVLAELANEGQA